MGAEGHFSRSDAKVDTKPKDASTVILLRESPQGAEVLLLKRHSKSAFMGGAFVFPGGKVDEADRALHAGGVSDAQAQRCLSRLDPTPGTPLNTADAVGFFVATARELFEEAGVLLGAEDRFESEEGSVRLSAWRSKLQKQEATFADLVKEESLNLDVDALAYWAHWITPSAERRRYDTRFFVVAMPKGQTATFDALETTEQAWMRPKDALAAHERNEIFLPPPTQRNLEELGEAESDSVASMLKLARERRVGPILPKVTVVENRITILLPWDPQYKETDGESLDVEVPPHGPSRIVVDPNRT